MDKSLALMLILLLALVGLAESSLGMSPEDVLTIEQRLHELGYLSAEPTQSLDADTESAIRVFQQANGLAVTGQIDGETDRSLRSEEALSRQEYLQRFVRDYQDMEPLKSGDINNQVQTIQRRLLDCGYFNGQVDGVFGDATRMAVERFQMVNGLPVTGRADGMTMMRLMAEVPITWQGYLSEMSCAAGDAGLNVYALQKKLDDMGYFEGDCTGSYGEMTRSAVAAFQSANDLEATGVADAGVWALIYSGTAVTLRQADVTQLGDQGESVAQIQRRLRELGYYAGADDGDYDEATETAVRLFQLASDLTNTGRVGSDTLIELLSETARGIDDPRVQERYAQLMTDRDASLQTRIGQIALSKVGTPFDQPEDDLYPGFAWVQYVCVAAGLPVTAPEALIRLAEDPITDASEVESGDILAFQTTRLDSVTMLLTIGAGEGRILYATPAVGWVVMSYVDQIESERVYRWDDE